MSTALGSAYQDVYSIEEVAKMIRDGFTANKNLQIDVSRDGQIKVSEIRERIVSGGNLKLDEIGTLIENQGFGRGQFRLYHKNDNDKDRPRLVFIQKKWVQREDLQ